MLDKSARIVLFCTIIQLMMFLYMLKDAKWNAGVLVASAPAASIAPCSSGSSTSSNLPSGSPTFNNAPQQWQPNVDNSRPTETISLPSSPTSNNVPKQWQPNGDNSRSTETNNLPSFVPKKVESGWDSVGLRLYREGVLSLSTKEVINTTVYPPMVPWPRHLPGGFFVSKEEPGFPNFWKTVANGRWEPQTFDIFNKYINPGKTTVVDFGTWIGPTLLYHGGFSRRSFGMEADPAAFAVVENNVGLNRKFNPEWGQRVSVDSGCISRPEDVGSITMRAGGGPGQSMSGINGKVSHDRGGQTVKWQVRCYTLPDIFEHYWGIHRPYEDVFLKVDIESYECKLVPSWYDWLKDERYLPKMYISFHPQISMCSDAEFAGVLRFFRLYDRVRIRSDRDLWKIDASTTVASLKKHLGGDVVLYQDRHGIP